ncbi:MAG: SusD/RagB family nutrient-binding outer membrane lipoprotein [Lewinellaceae bacterium]|nr:SusD/RagB family nutrient-binding outer membrane lipoprotein [Lewinellaceae bacterium]
MTKFKYTIKLFFTTAMIFVLSGCGDMFDLDINQDPNNPTQAGSALLLTRAQYSLMADMAGGVNNNLMGFMGMIGSADDWNLGQGSYNGFWGGMYADQLKDLEGIIEANQGETGSPQYLGIAQLLKAYAMSTMVDLFGDVPYSEALKGNAAEAIVNPNFDDDQAVYNEMLALIDEGLANVTNPRRPIAINGDLIYGGNTTRWNKFGRSLKLRLLMNTRLVNSNAKSEIEALITGGNLIAANNEDFTFQFSKTVTPDNRHPWYQSSYTAGTNGFTYILHQYMLESLEDGDPRWPYYFRRIQGTVLDLTDPSQRNTAPCSQTPACTYRYMVLNQQIIDRLYTNKGIAYTDAAKTFLAGLFGRDRADPAGVPLDGDFRLIPGVYPAGGYYDVTTPSIPAANRAPGGGIFPAMTTINVLYYQIEAILAMGVAGDARALFKKAIEDHIAKVVAFGRATDANSVAPPITMSDGRKLETPAYVNLWLQRYDNATTNAAKLNVVGKQLWFSSWGNGYDLYNFFRRTGLPNTIQEPILAPRDFPLRLPYPQQELTLNPNAASYEGVVYDRDPIFWDVQ